MFPPCAVTSYRIRQRSRNARCRNGVLLIRRSGTLETTYDKSQKGVYMTKHISWNGTFIIGFMLFALFFGAGNLVFPPMLGQSAGSNVWAANIGFMITGVGLPLLCVIAFGFSGTKDFLSLTSRVHPVFGIVYTTALYLTIGPLFAISMTFFRCTRKVSAGSCPLSSGRSADGRPPDLSDEPDDSKHFHTKKKGICRMTSDSYGCFSE